MKVTTLRVHGFGRLRDARVRIRTGTHDRARAQRGGQVDAARRTLGLDVRPRPRWAPAAQAHRGDRAPPPLARRPLRDHRRARTTATAAGCGSTGITTKQRFAVIDAPPATTSRSGPRCRHQRRRAERDAARGRPRRVPAGGMRRPGGAVPRSRPTRPDVREAIERAAGQSQSDSGSQAAVDRLRGASQAAGRPQPQPEQRRCPGRRPRSSQLRGRALRRHSAPEPRPNSCRPNAMRPPSRRRRSSAASASSSSRSRARGGDRCRRPSPAPSASIVSCRRPRPRCSGSVAVADFQPIPGIDGARERYEHLLGERTRLGPRRLEAERELDGAAPRPVWNDASEPPTAIRPARAGRWRPRGPSRSWRGSRSRR